MYICFYFLATFAFIFQPDFPMSLPILKNIRLKQHYLVYTGIELEKLHESIVCSMLKLKSAAKILCFVLFCCNIQLEVWKNFRKLDK